MSWITTEKSVDEFAARLQQVQLEHAPLSVYCELFRRFRASAAVESWEFCAEIAEAFETDPQALSTSLDLRDELAETILTFSGAMPEYIRICMLEGWKPYLKMEIKDVPCSKLVLFFSENWESLTADAEGFFEEYLVATGMRTSPTDTAKALSEQVAGHCQLDATRTAKLEAFLSDYFQQSDRELHRVIECMDAAEQPPAS